MQFPRSFLPALVAALSLGIAVSSASATTMPDVLHHVPVYLTDTTISIPKDQFAADGITRYPRGAFIDFILYNRGDKAMSVRLTVTSKVTFYGFNKLSSVASAGAPIPPGHHRNFKLSFYFRGRFNLQTLIAGKVRVTRPIIIF
jgi:hypothetical protein